MISVSDTTPCSLVEHTDLSEMLTASAINGMSHYTKVCLHETVWRYIPECCNFGVWSYFVISWARAHASLLNSWCVDILSLSFIIHCFLLVQQFISLILIINRIINILIIFYMFLYLNCKACYKNAQIKSINKINNNTNKVQGTYSCIYRLYTSLE